MRRSFRGDESHVNFSVVFVVAATVLYGLLVYFTLSAVGP